MHAVSYAEARADLDAMIDKVVTDHAPLAITRYRQEGAVLVSASEWAEILAKLSSGLAVKRPEEILEAPFKGQPL